MYPITTSEKLQKKLKYKSREIFDYFRTRSYAEFGYGVCENLQVIQNMMYCFFMLNLVEIVTRNMKLRFL